MGHAIDDLAHARAAAMLDHRLERGDHRFPAIKPEALGADIFLGEEFLVLLPAQHRGKDRLLAFGGELDRLARAFKLVLEEAALLGVGDVHVFETDLAAIDLAQALVELAHGGPLHAEHPADIDLLVFLARKAMPFKREVGRAGAVGKAERIEVGGHVPAYAVKPHQGHRRDRERGGLLDRRRIGRAPRVFRRLGDGELHRGGIERGGEVFAAAGQRVEPAGARPGGAGLGAFLIGEGGDEVVRFVTHVGAPGEEKNARSLDWPPARVREAVLQWFRRAPSASRRGFHRGARARGRHGCPHLPSPRSCLRRRPGRPRRSRRHGPCGVREGRCARR
ncbi:MAG: hypothetical protein KatS3mg120_2078 [Erythrobacter sp.]|nr:MAG: hypothetical protein KatS3mg120_2078 [Erythrobacter sp.]